jgi:hypothetical protein
LLSILPADLLGFRTHCFSDRLSKTSCPRQVSEREGPKWALDIQLRTSDWTFGLISSTYGLIGSFDTRNFAKMIICFIQGYEDSGLRTSWGYVSPGESFGSFSQNDYHGGTKILGFIGHHGDMSRMRRLSEASSKTIIMGVRRF